MGTRTSAFINHDLPTDDFEAVALERLSAALPAAIAVRDYWSDDFRGPDQWELEPVWPEDPDVRTYRGPSTFRVDIRPAAAWIHTGCRYRGFLSIEPMRQVHIAAFRSIARALGSSALAICSDQHDHVNDIFYDNGSVDECLAKLHAMLGPPQPSLDAIASEVVEETERCVPLVWFLEPVATD